MRKVILATLAILGLAFCMSAPQTTFAKDDYGSTDACTEAGIDDPLICGTSKSNEEAELQGRVKGILNTIYLWIGIISVIVVVIGGIQLTTSSGNPEKVKGAKNTILYALIGLIVTLMAFAITNVVIGAIDGKTPTESADKSDSGRPSGPAEVKSIRITPKTTLVEETSKQLKAYAIPDYAEDRKLTFSSSDESIVEVTSTGKLTAKKPGTATITVKANNGVKSETEVVVIESIKIKSIKLTPSKISINKNKTATIKAEIDPKNATDKTLTWTSSDDSIVVVNDKGKIVTKKYGNATITVSSKHGVTAKCEVTVEEDKITGGKAIAQAAVKLATTVGPSQGRLFVDRPWTKTSDPRAQTYIKIRSSSAVDIGNHSTSTSSAYDYASCDVAAATAIRYAGVDKYFAWNGTPNIWEYLRRGDGQGRWKDMGELKRGSEGASKLQPGDVLLSGQPHGHIFIYTGNKAVRKLYPNSNADSYEAGFSSEPGGSYYPHLFNLVEDSRNRTVNNITFTIWRSVNYDKKQYDKILK